MKTRNHLLVLLCGICCILGSCANPPDEARLKRDEKIAGGILSTAGAVSSAVGHPEYGIPATAVGGLLIKDSGK